MATINTNTKNVIELRTELNAQGVHIENVYVNGEKFTCIGYVSESDKAACLKAIETAVNSSETLAEAAYKLMTIANLGDQNAEPTKEIEVDGYKYYIDYNNRAAYDEEGNEVCNCRELTCDLAPEAVEAILIPRIQ